MMELQPCEAIKNNVLTTRLLGGIAGEFGADAFVLISTDKAVNPTSVMGASKRAAELVVQDLSQLHPQTRFVGVRFGNVMGSAGIGHPHFPEADRSGWTGNRHPSRHDALLHDHPRSAQLVLQAGAIGRGGEIFVLDMGEPVKIVDLAIQMIQLSGLRPFADIDIVFTGMRPGEKLFEELDRTGETISKTKHPEDPERQSHALLADAARSVPCQASEGSCRGQDSEVRRTLSEMLPEASLEEGNHEDFEMDEAVARMTEDALPIAVRPDVRLRPVARLKPRGLSIQKAEDQPGARVSARNHRCRACFSPRAKKDGPESVESRDSHPFSHSLPYRNESSGPRRFGPCSLNLGKIT